jgi:hypothetical protein
MSMSPIGSNPSTVDLFQKLRDAKAAETANQSGSTATAKPASAASTSANSFLADLQALLGAAKSADGAGAQKAALDLEKDLTNLVGGASAHHHRHHNVAAQKPAAEVASANNPSPPTALQKAQSIYDQLMSMVSSATGLNVKN